MSTKKWSEVNQLSKATDTDRAEARAELAEEMAAHAAASSAVTKVEFAAPWKDQLALAPAIGHTVAELLPPGFARYVRVFHPFVPWTADPEEAVSNGRWADIARDAGVTFGPTFNLASTREDTSGRRRRSTALRRVGKVTSNEEPQTRCSLRCRIRPSTDTSSRSDLLRSFAPMPTLR